MSLRTSDPRMDRSAVDEIFNPVPKDEDDMAADYLLGRLPPVRPGDYDVLDDEIPEFDDDLPVMLLDDSGLALSGLMPEEDLE